MAILIVLSAHSDKVLEEIPSYRKGQFKGLLDNEIGRLLIYFALFSNKALMLMEKHGEIGVYHSQGEEYGELTNPPKLTKKDVVIVVDIGIGKDVDFIVENISHIPSRTIHKIREGLKWEGFAVRVRPYTGDPDDE